MKKIVENIDQFLHVFRERLFVNGKNGIPMLRIATDLVFIGHFAPPVHDTKTYVKMNIDRHLKFLMTSLDWVFQPDCGCTSLPK